MLLQELNNQCDKFYCHCVLLKDSDLNLEFLKQIFQLCAFVGFSQSKAGGIQGLCVEFSSCVLVYDLQIQSLTELGTLQGIFKLCAIVGFAKKLVKFKHFQGFFIKGVFLQDAHHNLWLLHGIFKLCAFVESAGDN